LISFSKEVSAMKNSHDSETFQTIVIGGGQAGLAVGYYLAKRGVSFQILDANLQTGDAWRKRWDSLRLFTPARYAGLPGLRFPAAGSSFPGKDQVADYLSDYAQRFHLPIRHGVRIDRLWKENGRFVMTAGEQRFEADNVVVAMANYQTPRVPSFARDLNPEILQMHSHDYRNPSQLREGGVLVVGAGNSGADISLETAQSRPTFLAGTESGHVPWRIDTFIATSVLVRLLRFVGHHVLTIKTPIGRKLRPRMISSAAPLVRVKPQDLISAGVQRVPRVVGVRHGLPLLADERPLDVKNVIWCTGYRHDFPWIDLPIFDKDGEARHAAGIVAEAPGLYFVGLHFLFSMTSATLFGIARDARRIAKAVAMRIRSQRSTNVERFLPVESQRLAQTAGASNSGEVKVS
jgi:putative flavoprotein involved in K+ transport